MFSLELTMISGNFGSQLGRPALLVITKKDRFVGPYSSQIIIFTGLGKIGYYSSVTYIIDQSGGKQENHILHKSIR